MKKFAITLFTFLIAFSSIAQAQDSILINADLEVRYYENRMPTILPDPIPGLPEGGLTPLPRMHYRVQATVEFCRTVSADEFQLEINEINGVNYMSLNAEQAMIDCFGPARRQVLNYRLDDDVDTNLPFAQIKPAPVVFEGIVY